MDTYQLLKQLYNHKALVHLHLSNVSNNLRNVSAFKVLYSLIFELGQNKAIVVSADESSKACFRIPAKDILTPL